MKDNLAKINFTTLLGALILFALPWTNIQCSGRNIARQSGVQAIYGGMSLAPELKQLAQNGEMDGPQDSEVGMAYGLAIAGLMVLVGTIVAGLALFAGKETSLNPGLFAMSALIIIGIQALMGFPVDRSIEKSRQEMMNAAKDTQNQTEGFQLPEAQPTETEDGNPEVTLTPQMQQAQEEMGNAMAQSMGQAMGAMMPIVSVRTPWFYFELLALAIPTLLLINQAAKEKENKTQEDQPATPGNEI